MKITRYILIIIFSHNIPCYSQTWNTLGTDLNGCFVPALHVWNNKLYAGGCLSINNKLMKGVCSFDGQKFNSLGTGLQWGGANTFTTFNNKLYVGGSFLSAGGVSNTATVAGWDDTIWSTGGNFADFYDVFALAAYKGELYAGGNFIDMGFNPKADRIARWNGSTWQDVAGSFQGFETVYCMAIYRGNLYVGGMIGLPGGPNNYYYNLVRWNGVKWDSVGGKFNSRVWALAVDTINDVLYAGGEFTNAAGIMALGVAKWNDTAWMSMASGTDTLWGTRSLCMFNGELYAGGANVTITGNGDTLNNIYKLDGTEWVSTVGGGTNNAVRAMEIYNGNLYVGGYFTKVGTKGYLSSGGTVAANYIACYGNTCPQGVGIQELQNQSLKFNVYPNPAKKELNIQLAVGSKQLANNTEYIVQIKNSLGQNIFEQTFEKELKINTSDFKKGLYLVEVCTIEGKVCHTEKVVIE